jgi:hypothetical protein
MAVERAGLAPARTLRRIAEVYVEQAGFLLPVALLLFIPVGLVEAAGEHLFELETEDLDAATVAALIPAAMAQVATSAFGEVFFAGVAMAAVSQSMEGRARAPLRKLVRTLPYGSLLAVDLLFSFGLALGIVLLIVPGLIFFARYVLAGPLLKLERRGVRGSFRRSRELGRGHALPLLVLLGGLWLATDLLSSYLGEGGGLNFGESLVGDWAVATVIELLVTPVWAVAVCVVTLRLLQIERQTTAPATN